MLKLYSKIAAIIITVLLINSCGGGGGTTASKESSSSNKPLSYKGLQFYYEPISPSKYKLTQLNDNDFNALGEKDKLLVANKLLNTLFFGYDLKTLKSKIEQGDFISSVYNGFKESSIDTSQLENLILDNTIFGQYKYSQPQAITILSRFYAMQEMDRYYLNNWIAYILTQTIMFSPAYELSTTHTPNIANVYNKIVTMLEVNSGMRFITYVHMSSEDNWRRFRSPEDNGREMLEIYLLDTIDSHVPLAAKALQNWKLNTDSDTLEISLNKNTKAISLFGTTIYNGDDFYRELVKSSDFTYGVSKRLVDFFFPNKSESKKETLAKKIVSSKPEHWQDIILQIVFSKEYLLNNNRAQSAEETFYSLAKKMGFRNKRSTFYNFKQYLEKMHQATMKYKLGKLERVPLDTLSFANYHKFIREDMLLNYGNKDETDHNSWKYDGWLEDYTNNSKFDFNEYQPIASLERFINYLFLSTIAREPDSKELKFFKDHMLTEKNGEMVLKSEFNFCYRSNDADYEKRNRESNKRHIAILVLDYISRLEETYVQREVK